MDVGENVEYGLRVKGVGQGRAAAAGRGGAGQRAPGRLRGAAARRSSPAASASGWRWPGPSSTGPRCCCSTSRSARSTSSCARRCRSSSRPSSTRSGITFVFVTHDQHEALSMSDRVAVFNQRPHRAGGHAPGDLRAPGQPSSSPASSGPPTSCAATWPSGCSAATAVSTIRPERIRLRAARRSPSPTATSPSRHRARGALPGSRHPLRRRPRRRRLARRHPPQPRPRPTSWPRPGLPVQLAWRRDHVFALISSPIPPDRHACTTTQGEPRHEAHAIAGRRRRVSVLVLAALRQRRREQLRRRRHDARRRSGRARASSTSSPGPATPRTAAPTRPTTGSGRFEEETGCKANVKIGNTSDEMVQLMQTGEYDGVSASGDASVRLIAAGEVAPVNVDLIPNYADLSPFLKDQPTTPRTACTTACPTAGAPTSSCGTPTS